jgi:hypothetical protein
MSSTIDSKLDPGQIIKQAYDEPNKRIRVDATVSASVGDVKIVDGDGDELQVNPDGSLNVNVTIDAAGGDNIKISDGVDTLAINADGSINVAGITDTNTKLDNLLTELQQKTEPSDAQNIRALDSGTDSVTVPGVATAANQVTQTTELQTANTTLNSIDTKLPNLGPALSAASIPVTLATDTLPLPVTATLSGEPIKISGTIDGTPSGTEYPLVYNLRQQILATHDRTQTITYADFGTKDERITQIDYASVTFPGFTARKTLTYTLVGTKYRRDTINWTIV